MPGSLSSVQARAFRKRHNLALAYASEMLAPLLRAGARVIARDSPSAPARWRRGLIIGHTHIGDLLYRTCSLAVLRESLPDCEWVYAASPRSAAVLEHNPYIAETLPIVRGENSWSLASGGLAKLRSYGFDAVLCTNTLRHHPDLAVATAARAPNRAAFVGKGFSGLITHPVSLNFPSAYAGYFRSMVAELTGRAPDWPLRPRVYPSPADETKATEIWNRFGFSASRPVVAVSLKTRQAKGNWPEDVLLSVLNAARERMDFDVAFCGAQSDAGPLHSVAASLPYAARVLAGEAKLLPFAAFLSRCAALLTMDSGPRHMGNAMGIPVVFARNLSHSRIEAGKYCDTETDLAPDAEYLSDGETERVARAQSVPLMAEVLLRAVRGI